MKILLFLFIIYGFQCIMIGVIIISGEVYERKTSVYRDLIPFYWVGWVIRGAVKEAIEAWKNLK